MMFPWFIYCLSVFFVALFLKGFLIIRSQISTKSTCEDPPVKPYFDWSHLQYPCWLPAPAQDKKLIWIMIDALRFDFTIPCQDVTCPAYRRNNLTILSELNDSGQGHVMHFIADPPTATAQRLTGITSGTLPTFVEAGGNFSGMASSQDSLVNQLIAKSDKFNFLGDDTWLHLFPEIKANAKGLVEGYWSFGLFDLHTVDDAVKDGLGRLNTDSEITIVHFLGLDHCGHKYGPLHEKCAIKLQEMDTVIRDIVKTSSQDSVIIVMGDHGMTEEGDHGGMSPKEVDAALFFNTKHSPNFASLIKLVSKIRSNNSFSSLKQFHGVTQVDFTPSLALAMGLPIPYGNLGNVIPEMLLNCDNQDCYHSSIKYLVDATRMTSYQIMRYLRQYGSEYKQSGFDPSDLATFEANLSSAEDKLSRGNADLEEVFMSFYTFNNNVLEYCRKIWSHFNYPLMLSGLIGMSICSLYFIFKYLSLVDILVLLQAIGLFTTSFVIFEEWTVRFLLSSVNALMLNDFKNTLLQLVLTRTSAFIGLCREEQFPYCTAISHRSNFSSTGICVITSTASLTYFALLRRKGFDLSFILWSIILFSLWALRWADEVHVLNNDFMRTLATSLLPRFVYLTTIISIIVNHKPLDALTALLASLQRPFGGFCLWSLAGIQFDNLQMPQYFAAPFYFLTGMQYFFSTGHQVTVNSIQWEASFSGFEDQPNQYLSFVLLLLNTFAGPILASAYLACRFPSQIYRYMLYHVILLLCSSLCCFILLRHLMIWKIFAPRLLMQVLLCTVNALVLLFFKFRKCNSIQ